jgi:prevent-host-death family protein
VFLAILAKIAKLTAVERRCSMKTITAADAKNSFGSFLDAVQHEPVVVTKQNRPVGVMISMQDVRTLFGDQEGAIARALSEARIDEQLVIARKQAADGLSVVADDRLFEGLKNEIRVKYVHR